MTASREALIAAQGLIRSLTAVVVSYSQHDCSADEAMVEISGLLDGPEQREVEAKIRAALEGDER